ncbi:helix-turn-helix domain-containing protein [Vagococcus fluvialis]|uniref:helix-turn-helix domain-containing protein n=1 Tax=Vagococcus fluvialis TaxID=2738 RepID=UPI0037A7E50A
MNPYEKIKVLTKERGLSVRELEKRLGYSNGYFSKWKTVSPNSDGLSKVADYFNVSVDYLLGREEKPKYTSKNLDEMIDTAMFYDGEPLSDTDREIVKAFLEGKFGSK